MKKYVFITFLTLATAFMAGCGNKDESPVSQETNVSLIAPNGELIAKDMAALNKETALIIAKQYGEDLDFKITDIEYTQINDGYLALIAYQLSNGRSSNYAKTNSDNVLADASVNAVIYDICSTEDTQWNISEDQTTLNIENATTRSNGNAKEISFVCKSASNCKPCQVKVASVIDSSDDSITDGRSIKVTCSSDCNDCKLEATIK
ncbi:hypothetical protein [Bacteroides helcogenes]|uniref:Lipoprotein n=1 Tax=Bacteroides helcogenes (strain ATCC 35417 / DSM 20613 / JCM 6297 / CCUG 15421 / P 36-108) TaxID=693979 RepID=E6SVG9_BACT6|nr:hypothetical protein [Bacteroides helcogenes]ADV42479.1 hypothetical protein Bache_0454 [Bacteroides helcogenes P 36-108]MDY5237760.1 hypothetical protein [Bacteroides helcogenes]